MEQRPYYRMGPKDPLSDGCETEGETAAISLRTTENLVLDMFYGRESLSSVCATAELTPDDVFCILRSRFRPLHHRVLHGIDLPEEWQVDREALTTTIRESSFLFSFAVIDSVFQCRTTRDLVTLLTVAFENFSEFPGRQGWLMAIFVMQMAIRNVVQVQPTADNLEDKINALKSMRGRLTRRIRTTKAEREREICSLRMEVCRLRQQLTRLETDRASSMESIGLNDLSAQSPPDILHEMNEIVNRNRAR
jgi:hypothetical protein